MLLCPPAVLAGLVNWVGSKVFMLEKGWTEVGGRTSHTLPMFP